jgi:flagellar biosynthesis protein FliR
MEILTSFATTGAPAFALTLARVSGVFLMSPVFSSRLIPVRAKLLVALGITFAAVPFATGSTPVPDSLVEIAVLAVKEVLVGAALAFSVSLVFAAVAFAGGLIDLTVGFAFANVVDPVQNAQISVMGQFYSLLASAVFVAIGGPDMVIAGLVRSFQVVPVTEMPDWPSLSGAIVGSVSGLFAVGIEVAAPVLVAMLVTDAAVGFLARIAPQMNIFSIELPGKVIAMFLLLLVTAPMLVSNIGGQLQQGIAQMFRLVLGGPA